MIVKQTAYHKTLRLRAKGRWQVLGSQVGTHRCSSRRSIETVRYARQSRQSRRSS